MIFAGLIARFAATAAGKWIAGHALLVKIIVVALAIGGIWLWDRARINAAEGRGYAEAKAECAADKALETEVRYKAALEYVEQWSQKQTDALKIAITDTEETSQAIAKLDARLINFRRDFKDALPQLAADCRASRLLVDEVNRALGHGTPPEN